MTWLYCVANPSELVKLNRQRWLGGGLGVFTLLIVRPVLGRWASRRSLRTLCGELLGYGVAAVLSLGLCDVFLRYHPLAKQPPEVHPDHPEAYEDPHTGWNHVPGKATTLTYGDRVIEYDTDAEGDRVARAGAEPDVHRPTIVFAGESITSGIGLHYEETYAALVGARLGVQVVNQGVHGYGTDNEYIRVKDALARFERPLAVVTLVIPPQVARNADESKKVRFVLGSHGELVPAGAAPALWLSSPVRDLFLRVTRYHSGDAIPLTRALLRAIRDEAKAHGATPLFVLTHWGPPCLADETGAPSIERTLFEGEDLPHVTVDLEGTWLELIQHPGPDGHRRLADAIVKALPLPYAQP